jgi:hypothetical protein
MLLKLVSVEGSVGVSVGDRKDTDNRNNNNSNSNYSNSNEYKSLQIGSNQCDICYLGCMYCN